MMPLFDYQEIKVKRPTWFCTSDRKKKKEERTKPRKWSQAVPEGFLHLKSPLHFSLQGVGVWLRIHPGTARGITGPRWRHRHTASSGNTTSKESKWWDHTSCWKPWGGLQRWVGDGVIRIIRTIGITGASEESSTLGPRNSILINPKDEPQWCPLQSEWGKSPLEGEPCIQLHIPLACTKTMCTQNLSPWATFPKEGLGCSQRPQGFWEISYPAIQGGTKVGLPFLWKRLH